MFKFVHKVREISRNQKGFTLVELLVVVAIIAILAAVLLPKLLGYTNNARVSKAKGDLAAMRSIIESYAADEGKGYYPVANSNKDTAGTVGNVLYNKGIKWTGDQNGVKDPWGMPYRYGTAPDTNNTPDQQYVIISAGPNKNFGDSDDVWASSSSAPVQSGTPDVTPTATANSSS